MKTKADKPDEGWYRLPGVQEGKALFEERIQGLGAIHAKAWGKSILDLGCAEGLISEWLTQAGAVYADGYDYSSTRTQTGNRLTSSKVHLRTWDLNENPALPQDGYDIVLLLAILHKLKHPERLLRFAASQCKETLAVRTPSPVIDDKRSNNRRLDVGDYLWRHDFKQTGEWRGDAWVGVFDRR